MARTPGVSPDAKRKDLLTLRQAARLAGVRRGVLWERVRRGQVAVRIVGTGRTAKVRFTAAALLEAGLVVRSDGGSTGRTDEDLGALLDLIRQQQARITTLEEQRFQLAGQLGTAIERARSLESRMQELAVSARSILRDGESAATEVSGRFTDQEQGRSLASRGGGKTAPQPPRLRPSGHPGPKFEGPGVGAVSRDRPRAAFETSGSAVRRAVARLPFGTAGRRWQHRIGAVIQRRHLPAER